VSLLSTLFTSCATQSHISPHEPKLFGSEENEDLLISLINAIVSEQEQVVEVELKNPYNLADYRAGKMSILDIKAKSEAGALV
jgi:predicted transposase/invertase (TIGR01784 family)